MGLFVPGKHVRQTLQNKVCLGQNRVRRYAHKHSNKLYSGVQHSLQECKGVWWMPWLKRAMKDVEWLRKVSARCQSTFDPEISEWGNPPDYVRYRRMPERTWGSKTFQYPKEKKAIYGTFFLVKTSPAPDSVVMLSNQYDLGIWSWMPLKPGRRFLRFP